MGLMGKADDVWKDYKLESPSGVEGYMASVTIGDTKMSDKEKVIKFIEETLNRNSTIMDPMRSPKHLEEELKYIEEEIERLKQKEQRILIMIGSNNDMEKLNKDAMELIKGLRWKQKN